MEEKQTMNTSLMSSYTEDIEEVPIVTNKCIVTKWNKYNLLGCSCCSSCCGTKVITLIAKTIKLSNNIV